MDLSYSVVYCTQFIEIKLTFQPKREIKQAKKLQFHCLKKIVRLRLLSALSVLAILLFRQAGDYWGRVQRSRRRGRRFQGCCRRSRRRGRRSLGCGRRSLGCDRQSLGCDRRSLGCDRRSLGCGPRSRGCVCVPVAPRGATIFSAQTR